MTAATTTAAAVARLADPPVRIHRVLARGSLGCASGGKSKSTATAAGKRMAPGLVRPDPDPGRDRGPERDRDLSGPGPCPGTGLVEQRRQRLAWPGRGRASPLREPGELLPPMEYGNAGRKDKFSTASSPVYE
ncbi:hypothetical protein VTH06DRAFT_3033 [Thermothelomyces fergusii]